MVSIRNGLHLGKCPKQWMQGQRREVVGRTTRVDIGLRVKCSILELDCSCPFWVILDYYLYEKQVAFFF